MPHIFGAYLKSVQADSMTNLEFPPRYFLPSDCNLTTYGSQSPLECGESESVGDQNFCGGRGSGWYITHPPRKQHINVLDPWY